MTLRESAVATAKWWGVLPHVIWRFPFRYFKELRGAYLASFPTLRSEGDDDDTVEWKSPEANEQVIEFDQELFKGDAV